MNRAMEKNLATARRNILSLPFVAAAASVLMPNIASAETVQADVAPTDPLGIGLEGWPYPGPIKFLPVQVDGELARFAYMDFQPTGAANGRAIFLLHGKNFDSAYWSGPISWLRTAGFRVIVPDQLGFNKSAKPETNYSFELLADSTMALADSLGLGKITVLGHSTGGMLAVRLTSLYSDRVQQLVLEDPLGLVDYRIYIAPQQTETLVEAERRYTVESYRAFIAHYFPILPPEQYEPFVVWRMRVALSGEFERFARASALTYQMIYHGPVLDLYPTLKPPVLLMVGEADKSAPLSNYATPKMRASMPRIPQAAKAIIGSIPNGRLVTFPKVGHVPHLEVPSDFQKTVLGFLA